MEIREMQTDDLEEVASLEADIFSEPWSVQGFREALETGNALFAVAVEGKTVAGYCGMYVAADEGEITNVAVKAEFRRHGIGAALLNAMKEAAVKRNLSHIVLEVRKSNQPAVSLYRRNGYGQIGERKNFYRKPTEDALVMSLELEK